MRQVALLFLFLFSFISVKAQDIVVLKDGMKIEQIGKKMWMFEDKSHSLTFEQVSSPQYFSQFKKSTDNIVNFNVSKSVFWCRIEFKNESSLNNWCIQENVPSIGSARCFMVFKNKVIVKESRLVWGLEKRELPMITATFRLPLEKDSSCTVYVRLEDSAPFQANLRAGSLEDFLLINHTFDSFNGIYFGVMLFMLLYNLFLYFSFRDKAYIYYVFYIIFTSIFMSFLTGYMVHLPEIIKIGLVNYPAIAPALFGLSAILFTAVFLEIRKHSKLLTRGFYLTVSLISIAIITSLLGYKHETVIFVQLMGFLMCTYAITCGVVMLRKGFKPAKFYLLAWSLYMIGLCLYILTDFGVIPFNSITHGAFQGGSLIEAGLLSLALSDKVSALKQDKKKAQQLALEAARENERIVREQNVILEERVEQRTHEIQLQSTIIEEKNKDILSSIHYAKRIQRALLASDTLLQNNLPEHFVLYKPKDIVSGDFYWADETSDGKFLLLTGDCTGHGVPGAFMSLLNISILHELVTGRKIYRPDLILNAQRESIIKALNPEGAEEKSKDGMDAVLCSLDLKNNKIEFACANNPLWILRNGEIMEYKADKQPIGIHEGESMQYTLQSVPLQNGDIIYTFTDGFADQFGGSKGKKFKVSQLKEKLLSLDSISFSEQKEALDKIFEAWKGELEQVDDVLVIGIRV